LSISGSQRQQRRFGRPAAKKVDPKTHRFDRGIYRNVASVMGASPLMWLLPVGNPSSELSMGIVGRDKRENELVPLKKDSPGAEGDEECGPPHCVECE